MERYLTSLIMLMAATSCALQESAQMESQSSNNSEMTLESLLLPTTKSSFDIVQDTAYIRSKLQSDQDIFMMSMVIFKDSLYVLSINEEDASYLGISKEIYGRYIDCVTRLNEQL